ncbi:MAG: flagellar hook-basal body protein [Nitrospirota bacterium]
MSKGIYIALSGAVLKNAQIESISQNLANANTTGYKKDTISFKDYLIPQEVISFEPDGRVMSYISTIMTDFSPGNFVKTGNLLDIAIDGNGFIALEGNRYTKRGDLKRDKEGYLKTFNDIKVLGNSGPIKLPEGNIEISATGDISVNGEPVDSIKIVNFPQKDNLLKVGDGIFFSKEKGIEQNAEVKQAHLETSNVEVVKEMVQMIETLREFEAFQKVIQTFDEASAKVNNEIGRV